MITICPHGFAGCGQYTADWRSLQCRAIFGTDSWARQSFKPDCSVNQSVGVPTQGGLTASTLKHNWPVGNSGTSKVHSGRCPGRVPIGVLVVVRSLRGRCCVRRTPSVYLVVFVCVLVEATGSFAAGPAISRGRCPGRVWVGVSVVSMSF